MQGAVRGSPPYWAKAKKDIFAMIMQLGLASLLCSISATETRWIHLSRILAKDVDNKEHTDSQFENLNWEEKCKLIQSYPVTCAQHFDYQVSQFPTSKEALLVKIAEYQERGSPHT